MQKMTHRHNKELDIFYREHRKACTKCGIPFHNGMTVHLGYIEGNKPAVLCDNCSNNLVETVVRYYWMKAQYDSPEENDKLWRYMDLAKFIHLISSKELFFAAADSFDNPFEGAKGILSRKERWDSFYLDFFRKAISTAPTIDTNSLFPEKVDAEANRLLSELESSGKSDRRHTFISCWHESEYESEAMWKVYSVNYKNAVAIQTTTLHLYQALGKNPNISIGKVKYVDYNNHFSPINGAYWYKRKSFEFEREVRAIIKNRKADFRGCLIPVDLDILIDCVYISPYAPSWFEEVVSSVMNKYGIDKPLFHSTMKENPFY